MSSEVSICNIALSHVGSYPIQSLSESTKEARECKLHYYATRDAVLRAHNWGFAKKRLTLALLSDTYSGYDYAYSYPSDCLVVREIYDESGAFTGTIYDEETDEYVATGRVEYEISINSDLTQRVILTDKEDAELIYTARVTDPNLLDSLFQDALALRLAATLAQPLKQKPGLTKDLIAQYQQLIGVAKAADANEKYKKPSANNRYTNSRL